MPIVNLDSPAHLYQLSFAQIQVLIDSGRIGEALSALERMVIADPEGAEGHNDLAVLYHSVGRLADADREIERALELEPANAQARENRIAISGALDARRQVTAPETTPAALAAAAPAMAPGAPAMPMQPATVSLPLTAMAPVPVTATAAAPDYGDSLRAAEALVAAGEVGAAIAELERFVQRVPTCAEAWNDLGVLHHGAGRLEPARAALSVALAADAQDTQARRNLVAVFIEMGKTDQAAATLEPLLARDPRDVGALVLAGDIALGIQQTNDARAFYRTALAIDPTNANLAAKLIGLETLSLPAAAAAPRVLDYDPRLAQVMPEGWFDVVTCRTPIDRLPDPIGALREMARALRPGGKLRFELGCQLEATRAPAATAPERKPAGQLDRNPARQVSAAYRL
jgi:Flp pilus assembly protein TadD